MSREAGVVGHARGPSFTDAKAVFQVSDAMYDLRVTQERIVKEAKSMEQQLLDAFEAGWNAHIDALFDAGRDPDQLASSHADLLAALDVLLSNARLIPDPAMAGATDCYAVPMDDIDAARAALAKAKGLDQAKEQQP